MTSALNLEIPPMPGVDPNFLFALNASLLRISDTFRSVTPAAAAPGRSSGSSTSGNSAGVSSVQVGSGGMTLEGSHLQRIGSAPAAQQTLGQQYWESDRLSTYIVRQVGSVLAWAYESGCYSAPYAQRPADLGLYDAGFLFQATDWRILWRWDGVQWVYMAGMRYDVAANRPGNLGLGDAGFPFYATDLLILMWWTGTAWSQMLPPGAGGDDDAVETQVRRYDADIDELRRTLSSIERPRYFEPELEDLRRQISSIDLAPRATGGSGGSGAAIEDTHANRSTYAASSYENGWYWETDRTALYLSVFLSGAWVWKWIAGEMVSTSSTLADAPVDLTAHDEGFLFRSKYFFRRWAWDAVGLAWHYADAGVPAGGQIATSGASPQGGLWQACDGSVVACGLDNATAGNLTATHTEAVSGNNPAIEGGAGSTAYAQIANVISPFEEYTVGPGATTNVVVSLFPPSEGSGGLPLRVSMAWWMRR